MFVAVLGRLCKAIDRVLFSARSARQRKIITLFQDQYISGDDPFWRENRDAGPIGEFRDAARALESEVAGNDYPQTLKVEIGKSGAKLDRHFENLENGNPFWFRLMGLAWIAPLMWWTLHVSIVLNEWGVFLSQLAVWLRTVSLTVASLRNSRSSGWIIYKLYEDRVMGLFPSLIFYSVACWPRYRYLHSDAIWIVKIAIMSGFLLLFVSFWRDLWSMLRFRLRPAGRVLEGDAGAVLRDRRNDLAGKLSTFQAHIEIADISDRMKDCFLLLKWDADRMLQTVDKHLPRQDRSAAPHCPRRPKVPHTVITVLIYGLAVGSAYRYSWLMAEVSGFAIWAILRAVYGLWAPWVSKGDMSRLLSAFVAGPLALMPLSLSILFTEGRVLDPVGNRIALGITMALTVILFSNLVGSFCIWFGEIEWGRAIKRVRTRPVERCLPVHC